MRKSDFKLYCSLYLESKVFSKYLAIFVELKFCMASKFWCGLLNVAWLKIGLSERDGKQFVGFLTSNFWWLLIYQELCESLPLLESTKIWEY